MSPLGVIKQQQQDVHLVPRYSRNMAVKHNPAMILQQHKTTLKKFNILEVYASLDLQAFLSIPGGSSAGGK